MGREIESEVELEKTYTAGVKDLFTKEVRLATMVALMIPIMQQFTGVNVLMGYSASIFDGMCMNGNLFTVCNNIVNFLTTWSAIYFGGMCMNGNLFTVCNNIVNF